MALHPWVRRGLITVYDDYGLRWDLDLDQRAWFCASPLVKSGPYFSLGALNDAEGPLWHDGDEIF